ncbi:nucleotidyltransferase domain-containing protein [Actinomadura logoneensis]|uniref:nucleotidyltransferase domain-containing protein n=1 Tax=Actinomadura logoneensis TaxID=2293572 RepID=UPI001F2D4061|nr:nucleotidyltransferase domain-containing protein [Actinomadura logoneensis]
MGIAEEVAGVLRAHPAVQGVELVGSRARGTASRSSDWDYAVSVDDFGEVAADLPGLVAPFDPVAAQWDPLGQCASYLLVFTGPVKVDLLFRDVPRRPAGPWRVGPDTLPAVDAHFWDWILWLISKRDRGMDDRVRGELLTMSGHLLRPLGVQAVPRTLEEAVAGYVRARDRLETRYGHRVPRRLEEEVLPLVHAPHSDPYRPSGLRS